MLLSQGCFLEALRLDPSYSPAWHNLGGTMPARGGTVVVNGRPFTKLQCCIEAVRGDPEVGLVWCNLGSQIPSGLSVEVNGKRYASQQCYLEALQRDPNAGADAWCSIGNWLSVEKKKSTVVNGKEYTAVDCLLEALRIRGAHTAWNRAGALL